MAKTRKRAAAKPSKKFKFDSDQDGAEGVEPSALLKKRIGPKAVAEGPSSAKGRKGAKTPAPASKGRSTTVYTADDEPDDEAEGKENDEHKGSEADLEPGLAPSSDLDAVHKEALENYTAGWTKDRENQASAYDDLRFLADAEEGQWEAKAKQEREAEGRPILTINKCPQFVRQVTGDIRQMRPAIHVVPVDDAASEDVAAKILPGMLRYVEQRSDAKAAYFNGADQSVAAGIGHWRVYTEYAAGTTRNQEIGIGLIEDGIAVVWDPDSIQPTRKDAGFCFVPVDMSRRKAEKKWKGKSFSDLSRVPEGTEAFNGWYTDDHVRISEYWRKVPFTREIAFYPNGSIVDLTDDEDGELRKAAMESRPADPLSGDPGVEPAIIEKRESYKVERYLISASDILEGPEEWPGMHIPIVPIMGEEVKMGRRVVRRGIIRVLKDVQRLYNYAISADAEAVALQPKAPFIGTRLNFEQFIDQWETANTRNWPFLEYTPDPLNQNAPPSRLSPPVASTGIHELLMTSTADMSGVTGIYPAGLGQASNETSGKAILARQREGDTGTYHFIEAFGRGLQRTGEIVIDLIPHVYDTERVVRITGDDGKVDKLDLNKAALHANGVDKVTLNDVTVGAYEVSVEMGPSFATKREEARDGMQTLMTALGPESAQLFADLFAKSQDWPLADKIAKRAEMLLPPAIRKAEAEEAGKPPPPEQPPPQPTPEQQIQMQELSQKHELEQGSQLLEGQKQEVSKKQIDADLATVNADLEKARMTHEEIMASHAATIEGHKATAVQAAQDPRVDMLIDAVGKLQEAITAIADGLGEHAQKASDDHRKREEKDKLSAAEEKGAKKAVAAIPAPPDHTPALIDLVGKLATQTPPAAGAEATPGIAPPEGA